MHILLAPLPSLMQHHFSGIHFLALSARRQMFYVLFRLFLYR